MALPPRRLHGSHRCRRAKLPVTAPSHKPTSSYDIPPCQSSETLTRTTALEWKAEPDVDNCRVEQEKSLDKLDAVNQDGNCTVTAKDLDQVTRLSTNPDTLQEMVKRHESEKKTKRGK